MNDIFKDLENIIKEYGIYNEDFMKEYQVNYEIIRDKRKMYEYVWNYLEEQIEINTDLHEEDYEEYDLSYIVLTKPIPHYESIEGQQIVKSKSYKLYIKEFERILIQILDNLGYKLKDINKEEWEAFKNEN